MTATRSRRPGLVTTSRPRARSAATAASVSLALLALAACNDTNDITVRGTTKPSSSAAPTPSAASEQQAILNQYRAFWSSLTSVSKMPPAERRAALTPFVIDPELKSLLAGMATLDRKGQVFYGVDLPRANSASVAPDGMTAVVDDCQDSSKAGLATRRTAQRLTVGVARNHVVVTMKKSADQWKVYFVSHSTTSC